ncbi:MAG TPA: SAM-dependent methyltransferase [Chitinophagaceae bacterium]|nr:SAM-dependent methyltransferase [Chitinophagaceae bacterium]
MQPNPGTVYLLPAPLHEDALQAIPAYVASAVRECAVYFAENERTARRYMKKLVPDLVIDRHEWVTIGQAGPEVSALFRQRVREGKVVGLISEAGSPCIADPGQALVAIAQEEQARIRPLAGPNSILLALMASGMNGQHFRFTGYLPIRDQERSRAIRELESESRKRDCTQIFIETPYRNDQLLAALIATCQASTRLCIAMELTGPGEWIRTLPIGEWKKSPPSLHKRPAIFLLHAG